jgi:hypothetical protein
VNQAVYGQCFVVCSLVGKDNPDFGSSVERKNDVAREWRFLNLVFCAETDQPTRGVTKHHVSFFDFAADANRCAVRSPAASGSLPSVAHHTTVGLSTYTFYTGPRAAHPSLCSTSDELIATTTTSLRPTNQLPRPRPLPEAISSC